MLNALHKVLCVSLLTLGSVLTVPAGATLLLDRGLPQANLNNAAGSSRSNVAWGFGDAPPGNYYAGDKISLGAGQFRIDTLRTWVVMGSADAPDPFLLMTRFTSVTLFGGNGSGPLTALKSGNPTVGNVTDNADISITQVQYINGQSYQAPGNNFVGIFEVEFHNLNWVVDGSQDQYFSVVGLDNPNEAEYRPWFMHASNAGLGGAPAQGSDNEFDWFYRDSNGVLERGGALDSNGNWWDKSSDINVQLEGERLAAVPAPGTLALLASCLLGLTLVRRRA